MPNSSSFHFRHVRDDFSQNLFGVNPFGIGFEIENQPMAQTRQQHRPDIIKGNIRPAQSRARALAARIKLCKPRGLEP